VKKNTLSILVFLATIAILFTSCNSATNRRGDLVITNRNINDQWKIIVHDISDGQPGCGISASCAYNFIAYVEKNPSAIIDLTAHDDLARRFQGRNVAIPSISVKLVIGSTTTETYDMIPISGSLITGNLAEYAYSVKDLTKCYLLGNFSYHYEVVIKTADMTLCYARSPSMVVPGSGGRTIGGTPSKVYCQETIKAASRTYQHQLPNTTAAPYLEVNYSHASESLGLSYSWNDFGFYNTPQLNEGTIWFNRDASGYPNTIYKAYLLLKSYAPDDKPVTITSISISPGSSGLSLEFDSAMTQPTTLTKCNDKVYFAVLLDRTIVSVSERDSNICFGQVVINVTSGSDTFTKKLDVCSVPNVGA
jgi:hypothetical protein